MNPQHPKNYTILSNNSDILNFIIWKPLYVLLKPDELPANTRATYSHIGFNEDGSPNRQNLLYTVARLYQTMMAINRPQIIRDRQAGLELDALLIILHRLLAIQDEKELLFQTEVAFCGVKRIIETCELKRGFLSQMFPGWV